MDPLLISLLVRLTFSTIGLILNATLVYVTWKDKFLRNSCNLLIALDALTASLYLSGKWSEFALFIQNNDLRLPLSQCFFYHIITNAALFFNKIFMLYIGFDRFLAVNFPFWYEKKKDSIYLCKLMIAAFLIYSIFFIYMVVECFINSGTIIVKCSGFIVLLTTRGNIYNTFWLINLFITIAFYLFMWLKVKYRKKHGHMRSFKYTERLLKSLMVLAIVYFIGNILPTILSMIQPSLDENWAFYFYQIGIYVTILMSSANPILLYICSSDYKAAYRRAFSMQNDSVTVLSQSHN